MKKLIVLTLLFLGLSGLNAQDGNQKYGELQQRFVYFLDNGLEKIDLQKAPTVKRSFFSIGKPQLIIAERNDPSRRNLVNSYSIMFRDMVTDEYTKHIKVNSPFMTKNDALSISNQPDKVTITFVEIKLNVALPQMAHSKYKNPAGFLPFGFLVILD